MMWLDARGEILLDKTGGINWWINHTHSHLEYTLCVCMFAVKNIANISQASSAQLG